MQPKAATKENEDGDIAPSPDGSSRLRTLIPIIRITTVVINYALCPAVTIDEITRQTRAALATWLLAAGGRPDEALALARLGLSTSAWGDLPRSIARGDWSALADWAPARQLDLLHKICHDLMVVASGGLPRFFPPADLPVFWPILLVYFCALFFVTMRRQIRHMIKHRYIPFSLVSR